MALSNSEDLPIPGATAVIPQQVISLLFGMLLLTVGLAMFLSGTTDSAALVQPCIVVFGGTTVALLATFGIAQIGRALQIAIDRGLRGGTSTDEMLRALLKVCDISRRDGLLGVAEVRSDNRVISDVCDLIGDAAEEHTIEFSQRRARESEVAFHRAQADVFLFTAVYAVIVGIIGSVLRAVSVSGQFSVPLDAAAQLGAQTTTLSGETIALAESAGVTTALMQPALSNIMLPAICGLSLALVLTLLIRRLRVVHHRELAIIYLAFQGAGAIFNDNNVQRLKSRLLWLMPIGMR